MLWFTYGNISKEVSISIVESVRKILPLTAVPKDILNDCRCVKLPSLHEGTSQRLDFAMEDASNDNSCLMTYFQGSLEQYDLRTALLNTLVMRYLDEPTFDQLRTKEQLGYVVATRPHQIRDVLGSWFLIQSPTKGCSHIRDRLDTHLQNMGKRFAAMSDAEFTTLVDSVRTILSEKDKNQNDAFHRIWVEFATHKYLFER